MRIIFTLVAFLSACQLQASPPQVSVRGNPPPQCSACGQVVAIRPSATVIVPPVVSVVPATVVRAADATLIHNGVLHARGPDGVYYPQIHQAAPQPTLAGVGINCVGGNCSAASASWPPNRLGWFRR